MFKSIFSKYISAFMAIILMSFTALIAITAITVGRFSQEDTEKSVTRAIESADSYISAEIIGFDGYSDESDSSRIRQFIESKGDSLKRTMKVIAKYADGLTVMITDPAGNILMIVDSDYVRYPTGLSIAVEDMSSFNSGNEIDLLHGVNGFFSDTRTAAASEITYGNEHIGNIFVCASSGEAYLRSVIIKTIVLASLWVMLAALIAVYFITEMITKPLNDMRNAVKNFASGDYTVRIPVKGSTEIAELASSFNSMAESIEASEKMRNTFMANVSHDLRTPMTTITGFIDSILSGAIPPEKHEYYLNIIATEVRRLSRLVSQLLDISRIQAGDRKFNMQPFDVCEMARQILISFEQKIDGKKLDVSFDCDSDNMFAVADRDSIYQILYNICDNAVKFSYEGGKLELSIKAQEKGKLLVSVYNEGQGISKEDIPYVFERFYKGDKSRGLDKTGVGLGMFIAKTIIDAHHQTIWVDSEYNKYCCFRFTLEAAKEQNQ